MKVLNNLTEVAKEINVGIERVQREFKESFPRMIMNIKNNVIMIEGSEYKPEYILVDLKSDQDCKEYIMNYEVNRVECEVYTDGIVGVEKCKIIDIVNDKWEILRATVITKSGTQLNRIVKLVNDKDDEDYKQDGCVYFWER